MANKVVTGIRQGLGMRRSERERAIAIEERGGDAAESREIPGGFSRHLRGYEANGSSIAQRE